MTATTLSSWPPSRLTSGAGARAFDDVYRQALEGAFDLANTDGDGTLDRAEFTGLRKALGNPANRAEAAFDALDANGDGRIDGDEYLAAIRSYVSTGTSSMFEALSTSNGR